MKRALVSPEELLAWLNSQLNEYSPNCRFNPFNKREEDADGCNWDSNVPLSCSGVPADV
jgi:hypothetical protein